MDFISHPIEKGYTLEYHCKSVADKARELCHGLNLNCATTAYYAGLLHDVGKLNPWYQDFFHIAKQNRPKAKDFISKYAQRHPALSVRAAEKLLDQSVHDLTSTNILQALCAIAGHHTDLKNELQGESSQPFANSHKDMEKNLAEWAWQVCQPPSYEYSNLRWDICFKKRTIDNSEFGWDYGSGPNLTGWTIQRRLRSTPNNFVREFLEIGVVFSALLQADTGFFKGEQYSPNLKIQHNGNCRVRHNHLWNTPHFDIPFDTQNLATAQGRLTQFRTDFQRHAMNTHNFDAEVAIIEAPTGIGKTKVFLDLINEYRNRNHEFERVFYFSPLLALTDDFEEKITSVVDPNNLEEIIMYNNLYSATLAEKQEDQAQEVFSEYHRDFLYNSFNHKFIIATMQRLLMLIYSNRRSAKVKLLSLKNSLLILDEIQTLPKFLIPNFVAMLRQIATQLNSKILLVSATIPDELRTVVPPLPTITPDQQLLAQYQQATSKRITYVDQLPRIPNNGAVLVMANTRKKARNIFENLTTTLHTNYITAGIRKKNRKRMIELINSQHCTACNENIPRTMIECPNCHGNSILEVIESITVSTQSIQAGVDVSFSSIYREVAPLDDIVQVMGRLNREAQNQNATLTVYRSSNRNREWMPYSELEWTRSHAIIQTIHTSQELYRVLPTYYRDVNAANAANRTRLAQLDREMIAMNFPQVWEIVDLAIGEPNEEPIYIPDDDDGCTCPRCGPFGWTQVKSRLLDERTRRNARKEYAILTADLPRSVRIEEIVDNLSALLNTPLRVEDVFDEELREHNIWLPRREMVHLVYDPYQRGLDVWLS